MSEILFFFEKLQLYQHARAFRIRIYKLARLLPKDEYKLKVQMRDAARSLTNNIAEGHGRYTFKDRKRFMTDSRGSLQELADDINLCEDENYPKPEHLADLKMDARNLLIELSAYTKYLREQDAAASPPQSSART